MRIGIPRESRPGETLVAATAKTTEQLVKLGYDVVVEAGAGAAADQADDTYAEAGATLGTAADVWASDVVVKVQAPSDEEVSRLREGATLVSLLAPARSPELVERLTARRSDCSMERSWTVPSGSASAWWILRTYAAPSPMPSKSTASHSGRVRSKGRSAIWPARTSISSRLSTRSRRRW